MKPQLDRNHSHLAYLEPPHLHDPSSISNVASLPTSTLDSLPETVQSALYNLRQSTSIVYASYLRLQELIDDRFDRLLPSEDPDGEVTFSESSFFNYVNAMRAEKTYLLSDAHPDWRHKAFTVQVAIQPYWDLPIDTDEADPEAPNNVLEWWSTLRSEMAAWCDDARLVQMPDFDDTISEYLALPRLSPALTEDLDDNVLETPLEMPTPTLGQAMDPLHICTIRERDFGSSTLTGDVVASKAIGLGLTDPAMIGSLMSLAGQEFVLQNEGKTHDARKDSGVGLELSQD